MCAQIRVVWTLDYETTFQGTGAFGSVELAEDPPIEVIYLHKYFQIFIYFIWIDRKIWKYLWRWITSIGGSSANSKQSEQYFIE